METVGTATYLGKTYSLRDYPYLTEKGMVLPLEDGTDALIGGSFWLASLQFKGLEMNQSESLTLVGNNKVWSTHATEEVQEGR